MSWFGFINYWSPLVFSPKVTPDPADAVRLAEKFQQAMHKLRPQPEPKQQRESAPQK
jgi:hypothetical protein